jgi:hypothetical protein
LKDVHSLSGFQGAKSPGSPRQEDHRTHPPPFA